MKKLFSIFDINKNGRIEWWEIATFIIGFIAAGAVLNIWFN